MSNRAVKEERRAQKGSDDDSSSDEDSSDAEVRQAINDNLDEKLISFKSPNLMNQMLPHAGL